MFWGATQSAIHENLTVNSKSESKVRKQRHNSMKCQVIAAVRPAVDAECSFLLAGTGGQMKQAAQQQLAYSVFLNFLFSSQSHLAVQAP